MLAERLESHAFCPDHLGRSLGCPFCEDRSAYERYVSAGGRDFRCKPGPGERTVSLSELRQEREADQ